MTSVAIFAVGFTISLAIIIAALIMKDMLGTALIFIIILFIYGCNADVKPTMLDWAPSYQRN